MSGIEKCATGIRGLDEITEGGLPRGRPTLVVGAAGSGKTLLAMEFLVRGAREFEEPGVFISFEETEGELSVNARSLAFDVPGLVRRKKLIVDHVFVERSEIEETGDYDLDGLFVRLGNSIDEIGAKRVVVDGLEALFAGLPNEFILRSELRRLFRWLKERKVTAIITAEQGEKTLSRHGLEEYVSDCVIFLDHRVENYVATRRLRVVKYRGSKHGTNEYPTLLDEKGLSVLPISSLGLIHKVSTQRVSSGIERLDSMLGGPGYFKGSSVLISGTAGAGKSSIAAAFANGVCRKGGRCLYWASEESSDQIVRNMASLSIDLTPHIRGGRLRIHAVRPFAYGLENHLAVMHKLVNEFEPDAFIMDPISTLEAVGNPTEVHLMLVRIVDFLKERGITAIFTSLTDATSTSIEHTDANISSLMDVWILLQMVQSAGERNRLLYVLKARGIGHSNQMREFVLSEHGIDLVEVYTGAGGVQTGSARVNQEAQERAEDESREAENRRRQLATEHERLALKAQIASLESKLKSLTEVITLDTKVHDNQTATVNRRREEMSRSRQGGNGAR